jgi:hypothetical protein
VRIDLAALRQGAWHEYLTRFALGGAVTVAAGLIAKSYGPIIGGLFLAFPAIFPASATLVEHHERNRKREAGIEFTLRGRLAAALDARGAALGSLGMMAFAGWVFWLLAAHNDAAVLSTALIVWVAVAVLAWWLRRRCMAHRRA